MDCTSPAAPCSDFPGQSTACAERSGDPCTTSSSSAADTASDYREPNVTWADYPCSCSGSHVYHDFASSPLSALLRLHQITGSSTPAEAEADALFERTAAGFRIPKFFRCPEHGLGPALSRIFDQETAAVEVQRLYRGYRTRRHLADIAIMARKYGWWNVVEAAMLKHSTEQYYAYNKPETARERWTRIKRKAAKVGRGLAKDDRARKLAIQHWLEAIDARHRYGHNLHPYYQTWINSPTQEPFFYWLDIGEGREVDLESCSRSTLNKEQIKYLSPKERKHYEVVVEDGKLYYKTSGERVDTPKGNKYIFVMSAAGKLYVGKKDKGRFQHSSFLAGGAALAAGRLLVNDGTLELMEAHSGHYRPTEENFAALIEILTKMGADLTMAKVQTVSDDMLINCPSKKDIAASEECSDALPQHDEGNVERTVESVVQDVAEVYGKESGEECLGEKPAVVDQVVSGVEREEDVADSKAGGAAEACVSASLPRCDSSEFGSKASPGFVLNVISVSDDEGPLDAKVKKHSTSVVALAETAGGGGESAAPADFIRISAREVRDVRPSDVALTATEVLQFYPSKEAAELGEESEVRTKIVHRGVMTNWNSREGALISSLSRLPPALLSSSLSSLREHRHITVGDC